MKFQDLRELKVMVDKFNRDACGQKAEFFNPHMFLDGQWSVAIIFGKVPVLYDMHDIVASCLYHRHHAFWGVVNGNITLFIQ